MKKILLTILTLGVLAFLAYSGIEMYQFVDRIGKDAVQLEKFKLEQKVKIGDIIFQTSKSNQSKAIQLATNSKYSHMGIIYKINGQVFVYEAVQPVKLTALTKWINR